eukprot:8755305-Pyramimonas_sp.AAC.1
MEQGGTQTSMAPGARPMAPACRPSSGAMFPGGQKDQISGLSPSSAQGPELTNLLWYPEGRPSQ